MGLTRNSHLPCDWITASEQPVPAYVTRIEHYREAIDHWQDALGQRPPGH